MRPLRVSSHVRPVLVAVLALATILVLTTSDAMASPADSPTGLVVSPAGPYFDLNSAINAADPGDTLLVQAGTYGPTVIDKPITLVGVDWPIIDGGGQGTVVTVEVPDVHLSGFVITGSGRSLNDEDSGVTSLAPRTTIEGNRITDSLFGVYLKRSPNSVITDNVITGKDLDLHRRGDAVRIWFSSDTLLASNTVTGGRDIIVLYSERIVIADNDVSNSRYGLHFMYNDGALIEGNRFHDNSVGAYLMYSREVTLSANVMYGNWGPSGYGLGLKDMDDAVVSGNMLVGNRVGAYVDNSPREVDSNLTFHLNVIATNTIGLKLKPSVRRNRYTINSFVDNQTQVALDRGAGERANDWAYEGKGNYWSDYAGYDSDGDGFGEMEYRSNRWFDGLTERRPEFRIFAGSPSIQAIEFAARVVPSIKPETKLVDGNPMMRPMLPGGLPDVDRPSPVPVTAASLGLIALSAVAAWLTRLGLSSRGGPMQETSSSTPNGGPHTCPALSFKSVTKRFGNVTALEGVSFTVQPGETVALWGTNGAGKSTALRCLLGLTPFTGDISVTGYGVRRQGKRARSVMGYVPQEVAFHGDMSVRETIYFYGRLKGVDAGMTDSALENVDLIDHREAKVDELSGGLRQRLAVAVAMLNDPPVLLLDEPTSNLDRDSRSKLMKILRNLRDQGTTIVFTSHRHNEVIDLAQRVIVLEQGRVVADGTPQELASRFGWSAVLRVLVSSNDVTAALTTLSEYGMQAARNGRGIIITGPAHQRATALHSLIGAGIQVEGFETEDSPQDWPSGDSP